MIKISKIVLFALTASIVNGGEIQTGKGTIQMSGGFAGMTQSIQTNVQTYSMTEQHAPLLGSDAWFYHYNVTWYDSEKLTNGQNTLNATASQFFPNPPATMTLPSMDYRLKGLDVNLGLGRDIYHKDENHYLGVAILTGASIPWIESQKNSGNNDTLSDSAMNAMKDSKTTIYTYKAGLGVMGRVPLNAYFSAYGSGMYAYQNGTLKNDYAKTDFNVNGIFQAYDFGIRFQPVAFDKKIAWFTLSPRLYATLGYRYTNWKLKDVNMDVTGLGVNFPKTDFSMNTKIGYFGLGYSF